MDVARDAISDAQVAADLMLREPKTVSADATVADLRPQLDNPKVQMVLLVRDGKLAGVLTELPAGAAADEAALDYASMPETLAPDVPATEAFDVVSASPHRRVAVVDDEGTLLGLLCLNATRTGFCQTSSSKPR